MWTLVWLKPPTHTLFDKFDDSIFLLNRMQVVILGFFSLINKLYRQSNGTISILHFLTI